MGVVAFVLFALFLPVAFTSESAIDLKSFRLESIFTEVTSSLALKNEKALVLIFLSARCPCSASHEKKLSEMAKKWGKLGFKFFGIHSNRDETLEETKKHFSQSPLFLALEVLQDHEALLAKKLGALKTPHAFVLSPQGEVLFSGGIDDSADAAEAKNEYLVRALEAISQNKKPADTQVRALGCLIKRD